MVLAVIINVGVVDDKVVILNWIKLDYCNILVIVKANVILDDSGNAD